MKRRLPQNANRGIDPLYSSQRHESRLRSHGGFTLLELLISMTIVAAIAITLVSSLRNAFDKRESCERIVGTARSSEAVMEIIRNDLQCALPPRGTFAVAFSGNDATDDRGDDADDLIFYTTAASPSHPQGGNGEIKQIELTVYKPNNSSDYVLVRRTLNNLLAQQQQENPDEEILCRHVVGFSFRYYNSQTASWEDSWDSSQQNSSLPAAVEVTLSLEAPDKNPDGSPRVVRYTRIFQCPCTGVSSDTTSSSGSTGGSS